MYSDLDARILVFVGNMRRTGAKAEEIHTALDQLAANDWEDLPAMPVSAYDDTSVIPESLARAEVNALRARYNAEIVRLEERIEDLSTSLDDERTAHDTTRKELTDAREKLGEMRGKLVTLEESAGQSRRVLVYVAVAAAVAAAALLVVVLLLALTPGG